MGIWFLFPDFYGYRENGLGHETTIKTRNHLNLKLLIYCKYPTRVPGTVKPAKRSKARPLSKSLWLAARYRLDGKRSLILGQANTTFTTHGRASHSGTPQIRVHGAPRPHSPPLQQHASPRRGTSRVPWSTTMHRFGSLWRMRIGRPV